MVAVVVNAVVEVDLDVTEVAVAVVAAVDVEIAKKLMFGRKTGLPF